MGIIFLILILYQTTLVEKENTLEILLCKLSRWLCSFNLRGILHMYYYFLFAKISIPFSYYIYYFIVVDLKTWY
jgi:hypothetical protein